jgi:HlyD family secretion protein
MADMTARRAKAEQARAGAELELLSLGNDLQQQVATDIQAAQLELADVTERITASRDVLNRIEAVSPQDGIVTNIRSHTPGGVIAAGQPIMDIVPEHEPLVVEVKVGVRDIDSARVGADVLVRLSAFNHRTLAPLPGRLVYLAADQQIDDRTGNAFFTARAELDARGLEAHPNLRLYPGMPAELLILNERRRAIDYFVAPFVESFSRAFRER